MIFQINQAQAHQTGATDNSGNVQGTMHIYPADHPLVGKEAKFFFTFTDPDKLFKIENCNCKVFLYKGEDIIDQQDVVIDNSFPQSLTNQPLYTHTFLEAGDYSIHISGQPKPEKQFNPFALHFDVHVYQPNEAQASTDKILTHTGHEDLNSWQHLISEHHLGHGLIFGGGLIAAIILFAYGIYEKRKLAKAQNKSTDTNSIN